MFKNITIVDLIIFVELFIIFFMLNNVLTFFEFINVNLFSTPQIAIKFFFFEIILLNKIIIFNKNKNNKQIIAITNVFFNF